MRDFNIHKTAILAAIFVSGALYGIQQGRAQNQGPCAVIKAVCEEAGFRLGAAQKGLGLLVDCIRPIMQRTPQRRMAKLSLPEVHPDLVSACKARYPNFGQPKGASSGNRDQARQPEELAAPQRQRTDNIPSPDANE